MVRSEARVKSLGEVFTPRPLVLEMLRRVPTDVWSDPSKTFLDPTCGDGAFLSCVVYLKVKSGSSPLQALQSTFGVDIMSDNVADCRESMLKHAERASGESRTDEWVRAVTNNVVCHDALSFNFEFNEPVTETPRGEHWPPG